MRNLDRLLRPKSIAVIGGREAFAVIQQCRKIGFNGEIWPIHPKNTETCGLKTYSSVEELPGIPDAAYVAVNRQNTISVVASLARLGCGGVISYASGFQEADEEGAALQVKLVKDAGKMPLIGPNCYGLLNFKDRVALWPDQHGGRHLNPGERGVAIITQSSNIAINLTMQRRGLPIAYIATVGNQAQIGLSELALNLLDDPNVTALGLHVEGFDSVVGFEAVGRKARALKKPVIAMKVGRSVEAKAAAYSHTAAMAGSDAAADAFFRRIGIARITSLSSFLETLKLLHVAGPLDGFSISSMSCSGGEAGLMADACAGRKINFPKLTDAQIEPLQLALGPRVTIANPLDYHTYIWGDRPGMEAVFSAMMAAGFDLDCLVMDFPRDDRCSDKEWWIALDAFEAAAKDKNCKPALISTLVENLDETKAAKLIERGIAPLCGIDEAIDAIEAAALIGKYWKEELALPVICPSQYPKAVREFYEATGKKLLSEFGISIPVGTSSNSPEEVAKSAKKIGFPVAVKLMGLAHKSEQSGVVLGLRSESAALEAARKMQQKGHAFYVEEMVVNPLIELLVGVIRDEQFGLTMTIASGGVMVEIFDDQQTLLLPGSDKEIETAILQLKSAIFFNGFRGSKKADLSAAVETIRKIADFAIDMRDHLLELEINPLIICEDGCGAVVADVLLKSGSKDVE